LRWMDLVSEEATTLLGWMMDLLPEEPATLLGWLDLAEEPAT
jgi:hypothetical protein